MAIKRIIGFINKKLTTSVASEKGEATSAGGEVNTLTAKRGRPKRGAMKEESEEPRTPKKKGKKIVEVKVERNGAGKDDEETEDRVDDEMNDLLTGEEVVAFQDARSSLYIRCGVG